MDISTLLFGLIIGFFIGRFYKIILKAISLAREDVNQYPKANKLQQGDLYFK